MWTFYNLKRYILDSIYPILNNCSLFGEQLVGGVNEGEKMGKKLFDQKILKLAHL